jgi:hypothetical protein
MSIRMMNEENGEDDCYDQKETNSVSVGVWGWVCGEEEEGG